VLTLAQKARSAEQADVKRQVRQAQATLRLITRDYFNQPQYASEISFADGVPPAEGYGTELDGGDDLLWETVLQQAAKGDSASSKMVQNVLGPGLEPKPRANDKKQIDPEFDEDDVFSDHDSDDSAIKAQKDSIAKQHDE